MSEQEQVGERERVIDGPYAGTDVETDLRIAMIGCGGIAGGHLAGHRDVGHEVVALCDVDEEAARDRRDEFYPDADVYTDYREVLDRDDVDIVDVPVHPETREAIMEDALEAGKHVYSEKPFVVDLDFGERLVDLADEQGVTLAVNQSKRWNSVNAPMLNAAARGIIGDPMAVNVAARRNKDPVPDVKGASRFWALYNFGVHYFDFVVTLMGDRQPNRVSATAARSSIQKSEIPLLAQVAVDYDDAQATLRFDLNTPHGGADRNYVIGTEGTMTSTRRGPEGKQATLTTADGTVEPTVPASGRGFDEFVAAIEEDREPLNSGRNNFRTLELVFAAVASADEGGEAKVPGEARKLPENTIRDGMRIR